MPKFSVKMHTAGAVLCIMDVRPTFSAYHYGFLKTSCTARVGDYDEIMDVILGIPVWYGRHIT